MLRYLVIIFIGTAFSIMSSAGCSGTMGDEDASDGDSDVDGDSDQDADGDSDQDADSDSNRDADSDSDADMDADDEGRDADLDGGNEEVCDGVDNDDDGEIDEGFDCAVAAERDCVIAGSSCPGTQTCGDDCAWTVCAANCGEGLTCCDTGCVDLQRDGENCGACGRVCTDVESDACHGGACCLKAVRNGAEVCDDARFRVPSPYVPMYLVCRNDGGGTGYVSTNTGPEMEDGTPRCQGWETTGMNPWDHLDYLYQVECTEAGFMLEVDLADHEDLPLFMGAHNRPAGGGSRTSVCIAAGL